MINGFLIRDMKKEKEIEALKAFETLREFCKYEKCSQCLFNKNGKCYPCSEDVEMPADWDLDDLKID